MRFEKLLTTCMLFALLVTIIHADLSTIASIGDDLYDIPHRKQTKNVKLSFHKMFLKVRLIEIKNMKVDMYR